VKRPAATPCETSHSAIPGRAQEGLAAADALAWLVTGTKHLADPGSSAEAELRRLKAICEIAFITALLSGNQGAARLGDAISRILLDVGRGGRFFKALWHQPQHANLYLPLIYALAQGGHLSAREMSDLPLLVRNLQRHRKERPPFRTLDFLYSLYLLTGDMDFRAAMRPTAEAGCLGADAGLATFCDGDEYALTHGIFYLTGFGAWSWPFGEENCRSTLLLLRALAIEAEAVENWDLYAEYRIAEALLLPDAGAIGTARLLAAQRADGSWPGPADLSPVLHREGFEDPDALRYFQDYHTTLVAWMALTLPHFRLDPPTLELRPSSPRCDAAARYPELPSCWLQLPAGFTSLLHPASSVPPDPALADDAQGVLPWLEWWYWRRRFGPTETPVLPTVADLDEMGVEWSEDSSWRLLRCVLLSSEPGHEAAPAEHIITALQRSLQATRPSDLSSVPLIDRLVSAALLASQRTLPATLLSIFQEVLESNVLVATRRRDVFTLAPLLAFAGERLPVEIRRQGEALLREAASRALPFGFVDHASGEVQRRCITAECYLHQIRLAASLLSAEDTARPGSAPPDDAECLV
jgi:hypothetical protein